MPVNPDLQKERDTCSFHVSELTNIIYGGEEKGRRRRQLAELVSRDPVLREGDYHRIHLSHSERYGRALHKLVRFVELREKHKWTEEDDRNVLTHIRADVCVQGHFAIIEMSLRTLATDEQREQWLPLVRSFKLIGCFAQTEMGHGSDVRHLETRCDYDRKTKEFIVNTPQTSSMKWWPGGLGLTANHAILMSQLYIDGRSYGIHAFLVQIRDMETHEPLPGVEVGNIGPMMSSTTTDNGYLMLNNFRIPRTNMLMRNNEVSPDGQFLKKRVTYNPLIMGRIDVGWSSSVFLAIAVTIATRYSAVRRQTQLEPRAPESQVLDYQTQQMKLFPGLTACFAIIFMHRHMVDTHSSILQQLESGDNSRLNELHVQAAGFKAFTTDLAAEEIPTLRRSAGGHGYLLSSGLPFCIYDIHGAVSYEGENTVLYLQVARYLLKQLSKAQSGGTLDPTLQYLATPLKSGPISHQPSLSMANVDTMMYGFNRRTQFYLEQAGQMMNRDMVSGLQPHLVWNKNLVNLDKLSKMYMDGRLVLVFHEVMSNLQCSPELKRTIFHLFYFHMVHRIVENSGQFIECGSFSVEQTQSIKREEIRVLALIRPDAVGVVDAFDHTDDVLISTLGRYDGNVYEALLDAAEHNPLNAEKVHPAVKKHLLPLMKKSKL